jgi:hypothetical protein
VDGGAPVTLESPLGVRVDPSHADREISAAQSAAMARACAAVERRT